MNKTTVPKYSGEVEKSQMQGVRISLLFKGGYYKIEADNGSGAADDVYAGNGEQNDA